MIKENTNEQGYVLNEEKSKTIMEFFDAIDQMTIIKCEEKQKVFSLLSEIMILLNDNETVDGWKIDNIKELINQTDFKKTKCI